MERLYDKLAISLICLVGFAMWGGETAPITGFLVMLIYTSLVHLTSGTYIASISIFLAAASCGWAPIFIYALPLILFDALWERRWWLVCPAVSIFINIQAVSNPMRVLIPVVGCIVSMIFYQRIYSLERMASKMKMYRDEAQETNIKLKSRNTILMKSQDDEVYLATLRERNRIAREIHDNVGHMLTRSILQAGALGVVNKDENLRGPLVELKNSLDEAMTSIRQSVHDLHDDSLNLKKAIEESIGSVDDKFEVNFEYDASRDIPGQIKLCVAGVVKEALSNAAKYSSGDKIHIIFREHPMFYQLLVQDDGQPGEISTTGIGLQNMRDRAESVNGRIDFSANEDGFKVFLVIPR